MATILLIGSDAALLEGVTQTLSALGHATQIAFGIPEAIELATMVPPLLIVADHAVVPTGSEVLRVPMAAGGALVLYRASGAPATPLAPVVQRAVLADLMLPLERNRLAALVQHVEERARATGRHRQPPPRPEPRAR